MFIATALGSVGGVVAYYAWKDLSGQGLYVPGLLLWTTAAFLASALAGLLTLWTRRRPSSTVALLLAGGGFGLGEALWLVVTSHRDASLWLAAGVDVALAMTLLVLADRARARRTAPSDAGGPTLYRVGWLGSGAAFFWVVLLSVRTVVP